MAFEQIVKNLDNCLRTDKGCTSELSCISEREAFGWGFILATRIMVGVMYGLVCVAEF